MRDTVLLFCQHGHVLPGLTLTSGDQSWVPSSLLIFQKPLSLEIFMKALRFPKKTDLYVKGK